MASLGLLELELALVVGGGLALGLAALLADLFVLLQLDWSA
jgi:hypothetical protein